MKKTPRDTHFTHVYHKWQSYDVWFLRYEVQRAEFFVILDSFLPFYTPNNPKNQSSEKNGKIAWRYYHFTHMYHKWQSHHVWFLRYGAWKTESFVDLFWPFMPLTTRKIKILKKWKICPQRLIENSLGIGNVNMSTMRYILGYYTLYRLLTFRSKLNINLLFCFWLQY